jgi:hypothetical protein
MRATLLAERKERRRVSPPGNRRFMGDYLGIGSKGFSGEFTGRSEGGFREMFGGAKTPPTDLGCSHGALICCVKHQSNNTEAAG